MAEKRVCPPMGSGSVDLAAFHAADAKGHDLEKALADARTPVAPLTASPGGVGGPDSGPDAGKARRADPVTPTPAPDGAADLAAAG